MRAFLILLTFILWCSRALPVCAADEEYVVKAAFMERFTRFIVWPESALAKNSAEPFVIGVYGNNPFGPVLEKYYAKQTIQNKAVKVQFLTAVAEIGNCRILFIGPDKKDELSDILKQTQRLPILSISDTPGFAEAGVLINLFLTDKKVRYEINLTEIRNCPLQFDSRLLSTARLVETPNQNQGKK